MRYVLGLAVSFLIFPFAADAQDYHFYHSRVRKIDHSMLAQDWDQALEDYRELEGDYDYLFIKDLKIALQLAYRTGDSSSFRRFSEATFSRGWKWKQVKKELRNNPDFASGMRAPLRAIAKKTEKSEFPNPEIREHVRKLFIRDQWQALGALFVFSSERRERYAERKIAPDARQRVDVVLTIIDEIGYPGEMKIGNSVWASTLFSHYNSISDEFVKEDTLYPTIKSTLQRELGLVRISPFDYALIDNWYQSVISDRAIESYGILEGEATEGSLDSVNVNRLSVGLPTIEDHNRLLQLQLDTGIQLFFGQAWGDSSPIGIRK